jgi:4-hydroxybenzoate polyprenyltransferase
MSVVDIARSTHPGPTAVVTVVAIVLAMCAQLAPSQVVLVGVVILLDQASVGISNDWLDAARDRASGRGDKPIATGAVTISAARTSAIGLAVLSVLGTLPLGWPVVLSHLAVLAAGWAYNLGLKATPLSVVPFVIAFGLLPAVAALARPGAPEWWALAAGALLGVAAHFANVLPDLADDAATGIRGLPHRLGQRTSGVVIGLSTATASVLIVAGAGLYASLAAAGIALGAIIAVSVVRGAVGRWLFRVIMLAALLDVALLAAGGSALLA